jgi:hypothetical protein
MSMSLAEAVPSVALALCGPGREPTNGQRVWRRTPVQADHKRKQRLDFTHASLATRATCLVGMGSRTEMTYLVFVVIVTGEFSNMDAHRPATFCSKLGASLAGSHPFDLRQA